LIFILKFCIAKLVLGVPLDLSAGDADLQRMKSAICSEYSERSFDFVKNCQAGAWRTQV